MIYDCFLFNNELNILDIRLHELNSVVDWFVLVESAVTHTNKPKPLHFAENKSRFKYFEDKIIHIIVNDSPNVTNPWIINDFQFSQMARGLSKSKKSDIILFGDLDEIPKKEKVADWTKKHLSHSVFTQRISYYYLNCMESQSETWNGTHIIRYGELTKYPSTWIARYSPDVTKIPAAGWHFSYMGGVKAIQKKLASTTHQEFNNENYNTPERIIQAMMQQKDLFCQGIRFQIMDTNLLPEYVQQNLSKFSPLIFPKKNPLTHMPMPLLEVKHVLRRYYRKTRFLLQQK